MTERSALAQRLDRIPFFAPVSAAPLHRCWATNLSSGGLGLTAQAISPRRTSRGDVVELEFVLGDTQRPIRTAGEVAWASSARPDGRVSLGLEFRGLTGDDRAAVALFIANHRPRVVVARAPAPEQDAVRRALGHVHVDVISSAAELDEVRLSTCAAILLFSDDPVSTQDFLGALRAHRGRYDFLPQASITLVTRMAADLLLPLLNEGIIQEVLRPPVDPREVGRSVDRGCERWALQAELRWASHQLEVSRPSVVAVAAPAGAPVDARVIGGSDAMQRTQALLHTVAVTDVPVLLLGETGTGKELAAREIHRLSRRSHTAYVAQDCGALTETLLESELFGHVRGAFTGATTDHPGLFQIADGGTVFLDEVQNTSPGLQAKLMRVVEEGEVRPVGSSKPRRVDVRIIAASNVDLREAVRERRFRPDFYYRLNRFPIQLPPLREHPDDILPLVTHFLGLLAGPLGRTAPRLDADDPRIARALLGYDWPGNIRELKNTIERAILLTPDGQPIRLEALPDDLRATVDLRSPAARALEARVMEYERTLIQEALDRHGGVVRRAARDLDVNAVTLSRKLRRHGLT